MKKIIILVIVCSLVFINVSGYYLYSAILPPLKEYGTMEIERLNQLIVTHSKFTNEKQYTDLVIVERDSEDNISLVDFDMVKVNSLANSIVLDIENTYASIEEGNYEAKDTTYYERKIASVSKNNIVSEIAIGTLLNHPILAGFSPKIKIKYKALSSVSSGIEKEISNYGINHVMIELSIKITIKLRMVYPFFEQYHSHDIIIPILLEIIEGQVPIVYR